MIEKKMKKKQIVLFYQQYSTFVKEDDYILSENSKVLKYKFTPSKKLVSFLIELYKSLVFCITHVPKSDIVFIWFADYHSFFPVLIGRLFKKQVVIVVGGYDAVFIPIINFGVFRKKNIRALVARFSFRNANIILPVDESLVKSRNYYADPTGIGIDVGITHFVKKLKGIIKVVPTGYDAEKWKKRESVIRGLSVVTIGGANDEQTFKRKGLDFYIDVARIMPGTKFHIIGLHGKMEAFAKINAPDNVIFHGYVDYNELPGELSRHKVFAQFSLSEGLPNTLCEAMLCECIPVGSSANGIPYGIGNTGFILEKKEADKAAILIKMALESDQQLGLLARKRIMDNFSIKRRRDSIKALLNIDS